MVGSVVCELHLPPWHAVRYCQSAGCAADAATACVLYGSVVQKRRPTPPTLAAAASIMRLPTSSVDLSPSPSLFLQSTRPTGSSTDPAGPPSRPSPRLRSPPPRPRNGPRTPQRCFTCTYGSTYTCTHNLTCSQPQMLPAFPCVCVCMCAPKKTAHSSSPQVLLGTDTPTKEEVACVEKAVMDASTFLFKVPAPPLLHHRLILLPQPRTRAYTHYLSISFFLSLLARAMPHRAYLRGSHIALC